MKYDHSVRAHQSFDERKGEHNLYSSKAVEGSINEDMKFSVLFFMSEALTARIIPIQRNKCDIIGSDWIFLVKMCDVFPYIVISRYNTLIFLICYSVVYYMTRL